MDSKESEPSSQDKEQLQQQEYQQQQNLQQLQQQQKQKPYQPNYTNYHNNHYNQPQQTSPFKCCDFYRYQSFQELKTSLPCYQIDVTFQGDITHLNTWMKHIQKALKDIEEAAPCLKFNICQLSPPLNNGKRNDRITFQGGKDVSWTQGYILTDQNSHIFLSKTLGKKFMYGTVAHELLHALGFEHEHQRRDAEQHLNINPDADGEEWRDQYLIQDSTIGVTRFDPFSIMLYPLDRCMAAKRDTSDSVWNLKPGNASNLQLSELDKVALNLMYGPRVRDEYRPKKSEVTGLMYCGRSVMGRETTGFEGESSLCCGPIKGPNCPACRVIETDKINCLLKIGKWQGWTGYVYCGKSNGSRVICGPDNGRPCQECNQILFP